MSSGVQFVSLNAIITDLLNVIRGSKVSQSEPISKRQLEAWIHQYRSLLLKRDLDKGKMPNPDYIQEIAGLELEVLDYTDELTNVAKGEYLLRSKLQLPNTIDLNFKPGIMHVGTIDGHEFSFVSEGRSRWQQYKRFTHSDKLAFLRNHYLYVANDTSLKFLDVRGIFEIPTEVINFVNANTGQSNYSLDDAYPIPIDKVPVLKEMILKGELGIESRSYSDQKNDSTALVEPNIEGQPQQQQQSQ